MTTSLTRLDARLPDLTALALLALSFGVGIAFFAELPAEMVVGWHVDLDGGTRLTYAPRSVAAFAFPVAATGAYAVAAAAASRFPVREELGDFAFVYDVAVVGLLVGSLALQTALVAANL
ncbi:hypothetical protein M0R88_01735 [Halorussus gelatinilyticus]|uniref:Uncharacterized protein n=1 Tax=Halorussus gelatinilyticus TaxID=2937524 RepID=A0A8U0IJ68_9EURY|nr:hypothetical protein [Halorussus gelatinilyticus]UPW00838.1 hypothetical protein M0R88_01735 [Halorussus gelatinilyticus]